MTLKLDGKKFGRWEVLDRNFAVEDKCTYWNCICECGTYGTIRGSALVNGYSLSCGCYAKEVASRVTRARSIGNPARKRGTLAYFKCNTWNNIRKRVVNGKPDARNASYIRKGIELRMTKDEFYTWCDTQAERILSMIMPSIDRIDSGRHYELGNIQILEHRDNAAKH